MNKKKCQDLYKKILQLPEDDNILTSGFLKEFEKTKDCDEIGRNLSKIREKYKDQFNERVQTYDDLISTKSGDFSHEAPAIMTLRVNFNEIEKELIQALHFKDQLYYKFVYKQGGMEKMYYNHNTHFNKIFKY